MSELGRAIIRTLAYFDLFEFPLTTLELWRWLHGDRLQSDCALPAIRHTLPEIERSLREDPDVRSRLASQDGFWLLGGRGGLVAERLRRQRIAERKYERARRIGRLLSGIAGVRLIAVANTLAFSASRDESDIDFFIVTNPGALWGVRASAAGVLDLLGLRPSESHERDTACLSFLVSEDSLNLRALALPEDPYLAHWVASLVPLFDAGGVYEAFYDANSWIRETLPNACGRETIARSIRPAVPLPRPLGPFVRKYQEARFPMNIREMMNRDTRVVVNDRVLKFHTNDRRAEFRDAWVRRCQELGV